MTGSRRKRSPYAAERSTWKGMLRRCLDMKNASWLNYGGRGIGVCERWMTFENFLADMGPRPDGMTLERNDNDGWYGPENCRWATPNDQARNKRSNHIVEYDGRRMCIQDWAEERDIEAPNIHYRLRCDGWTVGQALGFEPPPEVKREPSNTVFFTWDGRTQSTGAWARECGVPFGSVSNRRFRGFTLPQALELEPRPNGWQNNSRSVFFEWEGRTQCLAEWIRECGINPKTVATRRGRGWTVAQALGLEPRP